MEAANIPHSPLSTAGTVLLLVGFVVAAFSATTGIVGNVRRQRSLLISSQYTLHAFAALMVAASSVIIYAFLAHDFTINYVAQNSDSSMSPWYKLTSYWGALEGSLMFWVALLSLFASTAVWLNRKRHEDMIGYVIGTIMIVQLFFLAILLFNKNPFATTLTEPPLDGDGLNPALQNYWMVIHPPTLYLGFVSATIPFAFAIGALASGRLDGVWLKSVRSWSLVCFFFLSFGLILGGRWAYEELGWGGIWAWDPVENAGLLPWFTITAFLHSIIVQEARGMLKIWSITLIILTFFYTIFGTFLTRSGVVQSVHAFGEDKQLAAFFIIFMVFFLVVSFGLLIWRARRLRTVNRIESLLSREFAFTLNNWILLLSSLFVTYLTLYPTIAEAFGAERKIYHPPDYNSKMVPTWLLLILLMGTAPLLAWSKTSVKKLWNQLLIPAIVMTLTMLVMWIFFPETRVRLPILVTGDSSVANLELPLFGTVRLFHWPTILITGGLVSFVAASIIQEFVMGIRAWANKLNTTNSSAAIGLMLNRSRTYGGYIVHLGVAIMTIGFAGRAFDIEKPALMQQSCQDIDKQEIRPCSTALVRGYRFEYLGWTERENDTYREIFGKVRVIQDGETIAVLTPSKRTYKNKDRSRTTEAAIHHQLSEDVYITVAEFARNQEGTIVATFFKLRVVPAINFVWIGFVILAFGLFTRMLAWALKRILDTDSFSTRAGAVLLLFGTAFSGSILIANAQPSAPDTTTQSGPPAGSAEHTQATIPTPNRGGHDTSGNYFHRCQANSLDAEQMLGPHYGKPIVADTLTKLVCTCGCNHQHIAECECGHAMQMRCDALKLFRQGFDEGLTDKLAAQKVTNFFVERDGAIASVKQEGHATTVGPLTIALLSFVGLALVAAVYVRGRKQQVTTDNISDDDPAQDEDYEDRLDEELADEEQ